MAIRFRKSTKYIKLLDPSQDFKENVLSFEVRVDPLTRRRARVTDLKFRILDPPDLDRVVHKSLERRCPFCAENLEVMTPKFPPRFCPEGRIRFQQAVVFPNAMPYDQNNAVAIFSQDHFVGLSDFSAEMLADGFEAAQIFWKQVLRANAKHKYFTLNWNYMPASGGSMVHPHIHLMADKEPSDHHNVLLKRSKRFWKKFNVNYWEDLLQEEKRIGERFVGETGNVGWLLHYAPKGMLFDVLGVFVERRSFLESPRSELVDFSRGLQNIFRYLDKSHLTSFNMSLFSGLKDRDHFWTHARLIPRFTIPPVDTSDANFTLLLHDESLAVIRPERICPALQAFF